MADLPSTDSSTLESLRKERVFQISGKIFSSPYDWGGAQLIPHTLGFTPEPGIPYAEYWLGVHPKAPSKILLPDEKSLTLNELIASDPTDVLGETVAQRFGKLPFLFKMLDAREMLSIQVHPNKKQAEEGFAREEAEGIAATDPKRTYKDDNHKPEYAVAQDEFWLIHGFLQENKLRDVLKNIEEFTPLIPFFANGDYKRLYEYVMKEMSDNQVKDMLTPIANRILPKYEAGELNKTSHDYWAAKAMKYLDMQNGTFDRGIFSIYFFNLVRLQKGQAIFQDAGVLHSYLEGPIIEVMTTSDNVARGGITPKYVDMDELIKLVRFEGVTPNVIEGRNVANEEFFDAPIDEFLVSKIHLTVDNTYKHTSSSAEILMGFEGNTKLRTHDKEVSVKKGDSVFVCANTPYEIVGFGEAIVYKICVPHGI